MPRIPAGVELSARVYRVLLGVFPRAFRREFGADMEQLFRDLALQALRDGGVAGLVRLWLAALFDLTVSAGAQHLEGARALFAGALVPVLLGVPAQGFWVSLLVGEFLGLEVGRTCLDAQARLPGAVQVALWLCLPAAGALLSVRSAAARTRAGLGVLAVNTCLAVGMFLAAFARLS
jgi:hypothetical protein